MLQRDFDEVVVEGVGSGEIQSVMPSQSELSTLNRPHNVFGNERAVFLRQDLNQFRPVAQRASRRDLRFLPRSSAMRATTFRVGSSPAQARISATVPEGTTKGADASVHRPEFRYRSASPSPTVTVLPVRLCVKSGNFHLLRCGLNPLLSEGLADGLLLGTLRLPRSLLGGV